MCCAASEVFYATCIWLMFVVDASGDHIVETNSGDGYVLASTLWNYELRKGDLFVLSWARVRRVTRGIISSEVLMCANVS